MDRTAGEASTAAASLRTRMLASRNGQIQSAQQAVAQSQTVGALVSMLALALGVAAALWLGRSISRPLLTLERSVQAIAAGDLARRGRGAASAGTRSAPWARALDVFKANALARRELESQNAAEQSARQRRADRVDGLVRDFQRKVAQSLEIVTSAATELDSTARVMTQVADGTKGQALASSAAAEETSVNVQTVAAGRRGDGRVPPGDRASGAALQRGRRPCRPRGGGHRRSDGGAGARPRTRSGRP